MRTIFNLLVVISGLLFLHSCKSLEETPQPIIRLSSNVPAGATADGRSSYRFTANVSASVSDEYNVITFRSSGGTFVSSDSSYIQMVRVNEKGEATSDWVVPNKGGDYFISASVGSGSNRFEERIKVVLKDTIPDTIPVIPTIRDTILISIAGADSVRADNVSLLRINLALKNPHITQLVVSNNVGSLSDGTATATSVKSLTVQVDQAGQGEAFLKMSNQVEPYFIRANLVSDPTVFKLYSFTPRRAYADKIFLEADSVMVQPNSKTPVNAFLVRNVGLVSLGTPIDFEAYQDSSGVKKPLSVLNNIANNLTNAQGTASIVFVADTLMIDRSKPVFIKASSLNDRGQTISKEISLRVKNR
ncbi:hypothetical protein [Spirosoma sp. KNUC1025]|uniref:hypothetical protein n=1 Tax=Spirosoma sp. KNUC1025 TaxID=2894082 RepID=UPI00386870F2|nr:hypothetical protein LN737_22205 [Spirosoma sp. KNUC1025]